METEIKLKGVARKERPGKVEPVGNANDLRLSIVGQRR